MTGNILKHMCWPHILHPVWARWPPSRPPRSSSSSLSRARAGRATSWRPGPSLSCRPASASPAPRPGSSWPDMWGMFHDVGNGDWRLLSKRWSIEALFPVREIQSGSLVIYNRLKSTCALLLPLNDIMNLFIDTNVNDCQVETTCWNILYTLFQTPSNIAYMSAPDIVCQQARHALQGLEGDSFHDHGAGLLISARGHGSPLLRTRNCLVGLDTGLITAVLQRNTPSVFRSLSNFN